MKGFGVALALLVALAGAATRTNAADVTVNNTAVPQAISTINNLIDITEFRSGGDASACPILLSGCKHYGVCILSPAPVGVLDAVFPQSVTPPQFTVGVEDGRQFLQCLLNTLNVGPGTNGNRTYTYCFECENVTTPPCPQGTSNCNGTCVMLQSDQNNCGTCGTVCGASTFCVNGKCQTCTGGGMSLCNGICTNLQTDVNNCGSCGNDCGGIPCLGGKCRCPGNQRNCGDSCVPFNQFCP
jgi:hypothetical protein